MPLLLKSTTFRAFRNRNYALFFTGQSISRMGMWMQRTAVIWVVYSMTHSSFMLGLTLFAEQFPSFLFSALGGIVSDRYDRYKLILLTQSLSMVQAVILTVVTYTGHDSVWVLLVLSAVLGTINAFDVPARQPLVHEMVNEPEDLPNALSLNSSLTNLAKMVGPALAGIVLSEWGAGTCFLVNTVSFIAIIVCLSLMKLPPQPPRPQKQKVGKELRDGFRYLCKTPEIGLPLLMLTLVSLLVLPYSTLLPVFAKVIFEGDATTYGYIMGFIGLGAISGAFFLASLREGSRLKRILAVNTVILGVSLVLFSRIDNLSVVLFFAVLIGFGAMAQTTVCNILVQTKSKPEMRGRAMSYQAMAAFGMMPLGGLLVGTLSEHIGAPASLLIQGITALLIVLCFYRFLWGRGR
ncbi:MFS transporter [Sinomicrobium soli]|uniref:MFS transporter n=1 Tax=Sinomicrobium sp. N-1-3-6 TaxID=2219864 RepID=UPI00191C5789|nr:MFS transporter [Sinomicrobium sp. N-1-3-6]